MNDARRPLREELAPAAVLLDVSLGTESGLELQSMLRAADQLNPPVVFVTGRRDVFADLATQLGPADDWVTKPWDSAEVTARVQLAIRRAGASGPI